MSSRPLDSEESVQDPEAPNPVTPTKLPLNAWASHYNQDVWNSECQRQIALYVILVSIDGFVEENRQWTLHKHYSKFLGFVVSD